MSDSVFNSAEVSHCARRTPRAHRMKFLSFGIEVKL